MEDDIARAREALEKALATIDRVRETAVAELNVSVAKEFGDEAWTTSLTARKPGADPQRIDAFEQRIGKTLPPDLRALLLLHDGEEDGDIDRVPTFLHSLRLLSLDEIEARWTRQVEMRERIPFTDDPSQVMEGESRILRTNELGSGNTVPFLGIAAIEDTVQVDLAPAPQGTYGQTFYSFETETTYLSDSVLALVEHYSGTLEAGAYVLEEGTFEPASGSPEVALRVP